jgi:hypothetical protein
VISLKEDGWGLRKLAAACYLPLSIGAIGPAHIRAWSGCGDVMLAFGGSAFG